MADSCCNYGCVPYRHDCQKHGHLARADGIRETTFERIQRLHRELHKANSQLVTEVESELSQQTFSRAG